ncbi:MAG: hypothetical protein QOE48_3981 [Mycobacterium sp.]|nr:hypothetical protein [Mycobacterium sp.]
MTRGAKPMRQPSGHSAGITRETWALQETPMGSLMLVWFEGDVEKAFGDLATDDSEYMMWFRVGRPAPAVLIDYRA